MIARCADEETEKAVTKLNATAFCLQARCEPISSAQCDSGLATMVRITLMYYVDFCSLFNNPEKDWEDILSEASGAPPEPSLFD